MDYAVRMGLISDNPCKRAHLPKAKQTEKECYTLDEAQQFINVLLSKAPIVYQCYFLLAIYGGFRRAELCELTWDNIDFENCVVSVRKTLNYVTGGLVIDTPKTKKSERSLKLPADIFVYLRKLQDFYENESERLLDSWFGDDNEFVFKNHKGEALSPQTPLWWLKNFCEKEGMRYTNIHSFRHLNASLLISNGVDVKTVQSCLGHAQASTTMNIYAHSFMEAQAKASEAVANSFSFTKNEQRPLNQQ
jgi:integrase